MFSIDGMTFDGGEEYGDDELTGLEEHMRDEASECGELAAMRREAEEANRMEVAMCESECEEEAAEDKRRFPGGRCALDLGRGLYPIMCETETDDIPF